MSDEKQWYECRGTIKHLTDKGGLAIETPGSNDWLWLPAAAVGAITYANGGDSKEILVGERIQSLELPENIAVEKCLQPSDDVVRQPKGTPHLPEGDIQF